MEYSLRGFGAERFSADPLTGEISVSECGEGVLHCLDHEAQQRYALTFTATDGGSQVSQISVALEGGKTLTEIFQVTTTTVRISVLDVNDHFPMFEQAEYLRVVQEGDLEFRPPLVIEVRTMTPEDFGLRFHLFFRINPLTRPLTRTG